MQSSTTSPVLAPESLRVRRYVPALTGLRAVAAYLVFVHHYNPLSPGTLGYNLLAQGYDGVSIFFVLSGFLMYHRYADPYFAQTDWSWRRYLQNRLARIFPLYALVLLITIASQAMMGQPIRLLRLALDVTLLKGFFEEDKFSGIAQSWSLTVEACFYVTAPLLFHGLQRWGAFRLTILLLGTGLLLYVAVWPGAWHGLFGSIPFVLFYTFFGRSFDFITGMWLARRWHQGWLPTGRLATGKGLLIIGVCLLWQASFPLLSTHPMEALCSEAVVYNYILPVGIGLMILGLLRGDPNSHYVVAHPVLQSLGHSSYAFYLIHIGIFANVLRKMGVTHTGLLFSLLLLLSYGLHYCVEKPIYQRLRGYGS